MNKEPGSKHSDQTWLGFWDWLTGHNCVSGQAEHF